MSTALNLRSPNFKSVKVTAPSAGYTAGQIVKVEDTVMVIVETAALGVVTAGIYQCEKIVLVKATGVTITKGDKVYFDASAAKITNVASGNTLCGRALEDAGSSVTSIEIDLEGSLAA